MYCTRHICVKWDRWFNPGRGVDRDASAGTDSSGDDEAGDECLGKPSSSRFVSVSSPRAIVSMVRAKRAAGVRHA
jgi:hypothetical protein